MDASSVLLVITAETAEISSDNQNMSTFIDADKTLDHMMVNKHCRFDSYEVLQQVVIRSTKHTFSNLD